MSADLQTVEHDFDLASTRTDDRRYAFPVGNYTVCSAQVVNEYNISGSYVVTFTRSNDGANGATPEEGAQTLAATGFIATLNCSGYLYLLAEVTTNATSGRVRVIFTAKADK